jgi:transcriptional/translational regulatory protein YebC/TACO1
MSGHSKWATIKHKKGAADKARGKLFAKLIKQVEVAARPGGGDPEMNPTLRTMFQKARENSVPLDTIERASSEARASSRASTTRRSPTRATRPAAWRCTSRR